MTERESAALDARLFGIGFEVDGKRVEPSRVVVHKPATNQAGEVEHGLGPHAIVIEGQGIDAFMPVAALSGNLVYLKQGAAQITMDQPMWRDLTAALAQVKASTNEGNRS